ncbi:MAG: hypothetical protein WAT66_02325 [Actinomycetota bacterium]
MTVPAAEVFRVERESGDTPLKPTRRGLRALGTAATGFPMPAPRVQFAATLRIIDQSGTVLFEKHDDAATIDALELEILKDLLRMDADAFKHAYGLPDSP